MNKEIITQSEETKNNKISNVKEKEEKIEQQDDFQSSTSTSNLNKSIDNLLQMIYNHY